MAYFAADFAGGREIGNAYGQKSDDFGNTEQSFDLFECTMHAQNNEDSNAVMGQQALSLPQATLVASTSMDISQSKAAKRARDQAYRERLKKRKIEMEVKMDTLTEENKVLKTENTLQKQALLSRQTEMDKLKHELNRLMPEHKNRDVLVNILSEKLASFDHNLREENQKLQNENDLLRQGMGMDSLSSQLIIEENAELKQELVKVKYENRALKVQLGAVLEKFIAENSSPKPSS